MVSGRKKEPPPIEVRQFTRSEIDRGITKLRRRIDEIRGLQTAPFDDPRVYTATSNVRDTIRDVFGSRSPEFDEHQYHRISHGAEFINQSRDHSQANFLVGVQHTVGMLEGLVSRLEEKREDALADASPTIPPRPTPTGSRRLFIVHGRDDSAKDTVARFLEKLDLEPIILHEQPNKGRTIIEKFETNADVDFAAILLNPADVGYPAEQSQQARRDVLARM
jgi:Predicted nucleotide-binding protein containing TIR-like domain